MPDVASPDAQPPAGKHVPPSQHRRRGATGVAEVPPGNRLPSTAFGTGVFPQTELPAGPRPPQPAARPAEPSGPYALGSAYNPPTDAVPDDHRYRPRHADGATPERDLAVRASVPLTRCHRVAVLSLAGRVGKTTTTAAVGMLLAEARGGRVLAVDANPDGGALAARAGVTTPRTLRELVSAPSAVDTGQLGSFVTPAPSGLDVVGRDTEAGPVSGVSAEDYGRASAAIERFYDLQLTDCGNRMLHPTMAGVLRAADLALIVMTPGRAAAAGAADTLDLLAAQGYQALTARSIAVVCGIDAADLPAEDLLAPVEYQLAARCAAVLAVPYDAALDSDHPIGDRPLGPAIDMGTLAEATRLAYRQLAALVVDELLGASA